MKEFSPPSVWRMAPFRLDPQPYLEELAKYNPTIPLAHAFSSDEVREEVHQTLAENQSGGITTAYTTEIKQRSG